MERREGAGAETPHPWRVSPPPVCEAERDTPEHLARVSPRPSDVGARALAALHRGCHALGDQHDCLGGNGRSPLRLWSLRSTPSVSRDGGHYPIIGKRVNKKSSENQYNP